LIPTKVGGTGKNLYVTPALAGKEKQESMGKLP